MPHSIVGKWGKSLAVRVPVEIARRLNLADGEAVEIEARDGDIVIRRLAPHVRARRAAAAAAAQIVAESKRHSLGGLSIRELLDEGRRG